MLACMHVCAGLSLHVRLCGFAFILFNQFLPPSWKRAWEAHIRVDDILNVQYECVCVCPSMYTFLSMVTSISLCLYVCARVHVQSCKVVHSLKLSCVLCFCLMSVMSVILPMISSSVSRYPLTPLWQRCCKWVTSVTSDKEKKTIDNWDQWL